LCFRQSLLLRWLSLLLFLSRSSHRWFGMAGFSLHFATATAARTFAATARAATAALMAATTARTAARATAALAAAALATTRITTAATATAVRENAAQAATEATAMAAAAHLATAARSAAAATAAASTAAAPEGIRGARNGQHGHDQGNTMKVHLTHLHLRNAFACPRRPPCGGPEDPGQCWTNVGRDAPVANSPRFVAANGRLGAEMPVVPAGRIGDWWPTQRLGQRSAV
jgi:hypothetical protein